MASMQLPSIIALDCRFYPLYYIVVDKKRLFYPLQRIYWIKSCIFAIINEQLYIERL